MPSPKVFVSSTCYDLGMAREQIRSFLIGLGYEPIMSEYSDVLYDPRQHTHSSCLQEVPNADIVILLVGSRFGGTVIPEALQLIDIERLLNSSFDVTALDEPDKLSVTQLEVLKAIDSSIPVFAFVEENVWHDHFVYQKNKELVDKIKFPSIEKQESARFTFEFLNFLRQRTEGNSVITFSSIEDIETHLRKQWAALFQRLLQEQRDGRTEERRVLALAEQLEDLKTAVLSSMENTQTRDVARNVIKYRRLADFLRGLNLLGAELVTESELNFEELLKEIGVVSVKAVPDSKRRAFARTVLLKDDGTFYEMRFPESYISRISLDWSSFTSLPVDHRKVIFEALSDLEGMGPSMIRYRNVPFEEFYGDNSEEERAVSIEEFFVESQDEDSANKSMQPTADASAD